MMDEHVQETELNSWIGRIRTVYDDITAFPINALSGLLDRQDPIAGKGTVVPPLWHWLFFLPIHRTHETRRDGHVSGGEFMPPIALPRRVWAGSKFIWQASNPLSVGESATRISRIASITSKEGKSGELVFVRQVHEFHNAAGLSFINEHLTVSAR